MMQQKAEMNVGDPTSKYPDAADMPEVKMDSMQKPQQSNPVVDAFETIMKYVNSLEQRQDPKAAALKEHLTAMIQAVVSGGGAAAAGAEGEQAGKEMPAKPMPEAGKEPAPKVGFDPYKDASEDETEGEPVEEEQMTPEEMKKKQMMKKAVPNKSITPLA